MIPKSTSVPAPHTPKVDKVRDIRLLFVPPLISELMKVTNMRGTMFIVVSIIKAQPRIAALEMEVDSGLIVARVN